MAVPSKLSCPKCGIEVGEKDNFCPACGGSLNKVAEDFQRVPKSAPWVALGLVIVGLIFVFVFVTSQSGPPGQKQTPVSSQAAAPQMTEAELARLPKDYDQLVNMGNKYFDQQRFHDAVVVYRKALDMDSSDLDLLTDYGASLNFLGDFEGAKIQLEKVLSKSPNHPVANFNLGVVYVNLGQNEEAKKFWNKYLQLDPTSERAAEVKKFLSELK